MWDFKACVVCLGTSVKLYGLDENLLRRDYNLLSGFKTSKGEGMPNYICFECRAYVNKFKKFKDRCHRSYFTMQEMLKNSCGKNQEVLLSYLNLKEMGIQSTITYMEPSKIYYEIKSYDEDLPEASYTPEINIPVAIYSINDNNLVFSKPDGETIKKEHQQEIDFNSDLDITNENTIDNEIFDTNSDIKIEEFDMKMFDDNHDEIKSDNDDSDLNKVYATLVPITINEAKAVYEILQSNTNGNHLCKTCLKRFKTKSLLEHHSRMHDVHISGVFECALCFNRYKSEFLLQIHFNSHHKYKYLCTKCSDVHFDKPSAKKHYLFSHYKSMRENVTRRPKWLKKRGERRVPPKRDQKRNKKKPPDFPIVRAVEQNRQYQIVLDRRLSKNYKTALYKCELCFKGFREKKPYETHMRKHDPVLSGKYQCDMCKQQLPSTMKMYKHMVTTHLFVHECRYCRYQCYSRTQAISHYNEHKNVRYPCPICDLVFVKPTSRMTHIRTKHPSTSVCNLCGHSFVSATGLSYHKHLKHSPQEVSMSLKLVRGCLGTYKDPTTGATRAVAFCATCDQQFASPDAYDTHLVSSSNHVEVNLATKPVRTKQEPRPEVVAADEGKPKRRRLFNKEIINNGLKTASHCEVCGVELKNDVVARKHYREQHPGTEFLKRYMCDVCGHTTQTYSNLLVHMRRHTLEKPFACPHCDRRFSMPSNRDRHIVVHTGEKKYVCNICDRRFSQNSALKLHIQTVHMKIPYAPWIKKNRKRKKEMDTVMSSTVLPSSGTILVPEPKVLIEASGECVANYVITYVNHP